MSYFPTNLTEEEIKELIEQHKKQLVNWKIKGL